MAGPAPKDPSVRARRNKTSTHAMLVRPETPTVPDLPASVGWLPQTQLWWADLWASPMAPEYDESDLHGLVMLAALVDAFWTNPTTALAAEIRLQRACFGLTPMDRRRLQWEIERVDEAQDKGRRRRAAAVPPAPPAEDPRTKLHAV